MKFSVLLSVYKKEKSMFLDAAIDSVCTQQKLQPSQIVLVKDGPLTKELERVIDEWINKLDDVLTVVTLQENVGLASALNEGLKYCRHELIARMDTDDIAMPDRFEKQLAFMHANPNVAVCSGFIEEWSQDFAFKISERILPISHEEIVDFAKSRNPISHPAAMFRKSAVLDVGGYPIIYPEDYALWGLMLSKGYKFANLPDLLLKMRVGNALAERRGLEFLKGEIAVFKYLHKIGFITIYELYRNIIQRAIVRLSPIWLKKFLYKYIR